VASGPGADVAAGEDDVLMSQALMMLPQRARVMGARRCRMDGIRVKDGKLKIGRSTRAE
jgi:hypothetical protein